MQGKKVPKNVAITEEQFGLPLFFQEPKLFLKLTLRLNLKI